MYAPGWQVHALQRQEVDLTDYQTVRLLFEQDQPGLVIHCAALTRTTDCEHAPALAHKLNVDVTSVLADLAAHIPLVFFSTDLVFDGQQGNYEETAPPNPLNVYAETKLAAERHVLANPRHTVVRTSLNGGTSVSGNRGFNEELRRAWAAGQTLKLFVDEFRCPIPAMVTAQAIWALVRANQPGLYHLAGRERLSRWAIGQLLAERWRTLQPRLEPASLRHYPGPRRAPDTSLNCTKIHQVLPFRLPGFTEWLAANPDVVF